MNPLPDCEFGGLMRPAKEVTVTKWLASDTNSTDRSSSSSGADDLTQAPPPASIPGIGESRRTFRGARSESISAVQAIAEAARQSPENAPTISPSRISISDVAQEASGAWLGLVERSLQANLEALGRLMLCRSPQEIVALQLSTLSESLRLAAEAGQAVTAIPAKLVAQSAASERLNSRRLGG